MPVRKSNPADPKPPDPLELAQLPIARAPRRSQWAVTALLLFVAAACIDVVARNENFGWPTVARYLFDPRILRGLWLTLWLTTVAMTVGIALGIVLAVMRVSANRVVRGTAGIYIWFFRGTPLLVQLVFWYNLAALFPLISIGLPFGGPTFLSFDANSLVTPLSAALLGLGLNEGAYMAEIVRAGIASVDQGQLEAGRSLGMRSSQTMRTIILPQAMRVIIPPTGNQTIGMLKSTSLVSVIALSDLLYSAQSIYSVNFRTIPLLICICLWYLLVTSALTIGQGYIERRFSQGDEAERASLIMRFAA